MGVEIGAEAAQFLSWEYINEIFVALQASLHMLNSFTKYKQKNREKQPRALFVCTQSKTGEAAGGHTQAQAQQGTARAIQVQTYCAF